jgi:glycosyltransferase involved in cell wall biosynthesis
VGEKVQVRTVGLGVDPELSEIAYSPPGERPDQNFRVVYAGSIGRAHELDKLVEVAASFEKAAGITFEFFGRGDYLEKYSRSYGDKTHIMFHGAIPRKDLLGEMSSVDVVFLAAEDSEIWRYGQSLHKVVEYMALGRPIIAAYSGFPSMINEADCGVFVPAGDSQALRDAILALKAMTSKQRDDMGSRGKAWIFEHRTYAKLAESYIAIMDEL